MKQKVFFFAAGNEEEHAMNSGADLRQMAVKYVNLYGARCLKDPETPTFIREMLAGKSERELPQAG